MKKRILFRLILMLLSAALLIMCGVRSRKTVEAIVSNVEASVSDIEEELDSDGYHDGWKIYADYEYNGQQFSHAYVSSFPQTNYKLGDPIKVLVDPEGKVLDGKISGNASVISLLSFAFVYFAFSVALPHGMPDVSEKSRLNYALVHKDLVKHAIRWKKSLSSMFLCLLSGIFSAMALAALVKQLSMAPYRESVSGRIYLFIPAAVCLALLIPGSCVLLKNIKQKRFVIMKQTCTKKECDTSGETPSYYLHFENFGVMTVSKEGYNLAAEGESLWAAFIAGDKRPFFYKGVDVLDDDLQPYIGRNANSD